MTESELLLESVDVVERRRSKSGRDGIGGGSNDRRALIVGILSQLLCPSTKRGLTSRVVALCLGSGGMQCDCATQAQ